MAESRLLNFFEDVPVARASDGKKLFVMHSRVTFNKKMYQVGKCFFHVRITYEQVQESIHKVPFLMTSFVNCADQETDKVRN